MADEANPPSPSGPGVGRRDHGHLPSRHLEGRRSSRHEDSHRQIVEGPIPRTDSMRNPCRVEPLPVVPLLPWTKRRNTSAPASVSLPLKRHLQKKSASVVAMVPAVVVVGIAAGRSLLLGKEQLAKPFPLNLWPVPPSSRQSTIVTS